MNTNKKKSIHVNSDDSKKITEYLKYEHEFRGKIISYCLEIENFLEFIMSRHYTSKKLQKKFINEICSEIGFRGKITIFKRIAIPDMHMNSGSKEKLIDNLENKILKYRNSLAHDTSSLFDNLVSAKNSKKLFILLKVKLENPICLMNKGKN